MGWMANEASDEVARCAREPRAIGVSRSGARNSQRSADPWRNAADVLRHQHMASSELPSANLLLRFALSAVERLKQAGLGYNRKSVEETVHHFVVSQRPITVF